MLKDITEVKTHQNYTLELKFEDGISGTIDVSTLIEFSGIFERLKDPEYFRLVKLNSEVGTIYWPNGADLDPDVLYAEITGHPIQLGQQPNQAA